MKRKRIFLLLATLCFLGLTTVAWFTWQNLDFRIRLKLTGIQYQQIRKDSYWNLTIKDRSFSDLSLIRGVPITSLNLYKTGVTDLSPLSGMSLEYLSLRSTPVSSLKPLARMPLQKLNIQNTQINDLTPLYEMPLVSLVVGDRVFLRRETESEVIYDNYTSLDRISKGLDVIRNMDTLKEINAMPVEQFWQKFDKGKFRWPYPWYGPDDKKFPTLSFPKDLVLITIGVHVDNLTGQDIPHRVSFMDIRYFPAKLYFLKLGKSKDGITLVRIEVSTNRALLRRGIEEAWIPLGWRREKLISENVEFE